MQPTQPANNNHANRTITIQTNGATPNTIPIAATPFAFAAAARAQAKLRMAITGPSGSGKTMSALFIAQGIAQSIQAKENRKAKIAVIDTENFSASLYADRFAFDVAAIDAPYTIGKYAAGIKAAAGYDVLVIDSITHAWAGEGGLLNKKEQLDARGGNSYTNWATITKEHESFKAWLLKCSSHLIVTMRSKQDYILEEGKNGKQVPRKVGLAPIQRDGMEYEFTTVLDLAMNHEASASKDRTGLFDGQFFRPTAETGVAIYAWLMSGEAKAAAIVPASNANNLAFVETTAAHQPSPTQSIASENVVEDLFFEPDEINVSMAAQPSATPENIKRIAGKTYPLKGRYAGRTLGSFTTKEAESIVTFYEKSATPVAQQLIADLRELRNGGFLNDNANGSAS